MLKYSEFDADLALPGDLRVPSSPVIRLGQPRRLLRQARVDPSDLAGQVLPEWIAPAHLETKANAEKIRWRM
jgi:hypothetical protein